MKVAEKIAANVVKKIVVREQAEWPPVCSGLIHQPERPIVDNSESMEKPHTLKNRQR